MGATTSTVITGPVLGIEHALTPLGRSLRRPFAALYDWMVEHMKLIVEEQRRYDRATAG